MIELTPKVIELVEGLFPADGQQAVKQLLRTKCAQTIVGKHKSSPPKDLDIIRCAVLELCDGDFVRLRSLVRLANTDWRDVLAALEAKRKHQKSK